MSRRRAAALASGMLMLLTVSLSAQGAPDRTAADPMTMAKAVQEAIDNNLELMSEKYGIPVAEAARISAALRPNPVISVSADHMDWLGTGYNLINNGGPPEYSVRVDWPIERAHKRELRLETAQYARQIAEIQIQDFIRKLRNDVDLASVDAIAAKADLQLARDNYKTLENLVSLNESRVKAGSISPLELTRSRVAMLQFRANVSRAELSLLQAQTRLQALLGRKPGSNLVDITDDLSVSGQNLPLELGHLENLSRQHRPDLAAAVLTQTRSQADLRLQIAQGKIDYTVGSEYRRQQGLSGTSNSVGLFFSAPLPFYNRNQGEIARAEAERQQITSRITALQFSISSEVKTAYQSFASSRTLVQEIENNLLKPAQEARDTVGYTYKSGASTLIEFLDAQRAFNDTMQSYYQAKADYLRAIVALTSAVGTEIVP